MRYFMTFCYDGTRYHGWQIQPEAISVQEVMQNAMGILLRHPVELTGAGRTDAGVHARRMVAHFDECQPIDCLQLTYRLNRLLPCDVAVFSIEPVDESMHARFSATSRTYHYYIHTIKNPFLRKTSCELHYELDFCQMNQAARMLLSYRDFGAFCKSHSDVKTTLCTVTEARWQPLGDGKWMFRITANRFLRNMVRAVVGTLIEVGRHRLSLEEFQRVVEGKQRSAAGESMPGHALFLENITY